MAGEKGARAQGKGKQANGRSPHGAALGDQTGLLFYSVTEPALSPEHGTQEASALQNPTLSCQVPRERVDSLMPGHQGTEEHCGTGSFKGMALTSIPPPARSLGVRPLLVLLLEAMRELL